MLFTLPLIFFSSYLSSYFHSCHCRDLTLLKTNCTTEQATELQNAIAQRVEKGIMYPQVGTVVTVNLRYMQFPEGFIINLVLKLRKSLNLCEGCDYIISGTGTCYYKLLGAYNMSLVNNYCRIEYNSTVVNVKVTGTEFSLKNIVLLNNV